MFLGLLPLLLALSIKSAESCFGGLSPPPSRPPPPPSPPPTSSGPQGPAPSLTSTPNGGSTCGTTSSGLCQFPYKHSDNTMRSECFLSSGVKKCYTRLQDDYTGDPNSLATCGSACPLSGYHTHSELIAELERLANQHRNDSETFSVGSSQRGADFRGIRISAGIGSLPADSEIMRLRPKVKFVANMHGNEVVGRELLIHLAMHLLQLNKAGDSRVHKLLSNSDLYILPTMNPDGYKNAKYKQCSGVTGRYTVGGQDLNRNFPDYPEYNSWVQSGSSVSSLNSGRQKETQNMMKWILDNVFVLSANFHDGAVVANYPWDRYRNGNQWKSPDHEEFLRMAKSYASSHDNMYTGRHCGDTFANGVTNGAQWYPVSGGMQDFNYLYGGTMEITVEVSCCKFPDKSKLFGEWFNNDGAFLSYLEQAQTGIKGFITPVVANTRVKVRKAPSSTGAATEAWREVTVRADVGKGGAYWKILDDGWYDVQAVVMNGLNEVRSSDIERVNVVTESSKVPLRLDLTLNAAKRGRGPA